MQLLPDRMTGRVRSRRGQAVLEAFGASIDDSGRMIVPAWAALRDIRAGTTLHFPNHKVKIPRAIRRDLRIDHPLRLEVIR